MSKSTLALIAAGSAAAGATISAWVLSSRSPSARPLPTPTIALPPSNAPPASPPQPQPGPVPTASASTPMGLAPVNPTGIVQYMSPSLPSLNSTPSHLSHYNTQTRNPNWVAEHFTPQSLALNNSSRKNSSFYEDPAVPPIFRAKLSDYSRSGYDRGHQVPAADCKWSQDAMDSTFVLSNMCPQVGDGFNRDYWAHFEEFCRSLARRYPSVRVVTGPLYLPKQYPDGKWRVNYEVIGSPPNVAVPTHFFKVIYAEEGVNASSGRVALGAFVLPNTEIPSNKPLTDFEVPLEAVERASGFMFADKLPAERRKRLCAEVSCTTIIRDFSDKAKQRSTS